MDFPPVGKQIKCRPIDTRKHQRTFKSYTGVHYEVLHISGMFYTLLYRCIYVADSVSNYKK